jgi:hypothetical protein
MISREQLKLEIDLVDDKNIEILHRIILALKADFVIQPQLQAEYINPLKNSIRSERDIISPIDVG